MRRFTFDFLPGAVLEDATPRGYRRLLQRTVIGTAAAFDDAAEAVLDWQVQRRSGIAALSDSGDDAPRPTEGLEGAVVVPVLGRTVRAPFRVTRVLQEPDLVGFAYGTLPGHPEVGEGGVPRPPHRHGDGLRAPRAVPPRVPVLARRPRRRSAAAPIHRALPPRAAVRRCSRIRGFGRRSAPPNP